MSGPKCRSAMSKQEIVRVVLGDELAKKGVALSSTFDVTIDPTTNVMRISDAAGKTYFMPDGSMHASGYRSGQAVAIDRTALSLARSCLKGKQFVDQLNTLWKHRSTVVTMNGHTWVRREVNHWSQWVRVDKASVL